MALPLFFIFSLIGCKEVRYTIRDIGRESNYQLTEPSGLPILKINTGGREIDSTEIWVEDSSYSLYDKTGALIIEGTMDVKGRGHTTWEMPKKPYALKLDDKASFFGMPAHKRWAVLANYADKTLIRTDTAFTMGRIFDHLAWTPHSVHVDLFLNDEYRGVFQLTEQIKVDKNRVDVADIVSTDNPDGGYLMEVDNRRGDPFNFTTEKGVIICLSDPDDGYDEIITAGSQPLFEKIRIDVQQFEDVLFSAGFTDPNTGYARYADVDSFIDWYLVSEITKNNDSRFQSSVYLFYDADMKKYRMGPLWDFDIAMGNIDYEDSQYPEGFWIKDSVWFGRLFEDPSFVSRLKNRYNEKRAELETIFKYIDEHAAYLSKPQEYNFMKWTILDEKVWPNPQTAGSYSGEVDYLKSWIRQRLNWLDTAIEML